MRLITYSHAETVAIGAWIDGDKRVVDLLKAASLQGVGPASAFRSMQAFIEAGAKVWDATRELLQAPPSDALLETADVRLLPPIPRPVQIRDCLSFPLHLENVRRQTGEYMIGSSANPGDVRSRLESARFFDVPANYFEYPVYYITNSQSIVATGVDIPWPPYSHVIDYELEWAVVIGSAGTAISKTKARDHIFGYTMFNDWSARDEQLKAMGAALNLGPGPGKDFASTLGPCIVTADEIPDPYNLQMSAYVDGERYSDGNTSSMHFSFEDLIEHITRGHGLSAGEIICSGTVGGGCAFEIGRLVSPGATVALEVEKIGRLENRVLAPHIREGASAATRDQILKSLTRVVPAGT